MMIRGHLLSSTTILKHFQTENCKFSKVLPSQQIYCLLEFNNWCGKTRVMVLQDGGKSFTISAFIEIQYHNVTEKQTDLI